MAARRRVACDPHDKQKGADDRRHCEGADHDIVGPRLHVSSAPRILRPVVPGRRGGPIRCRREADYAPLTVEIGFEPWVVGNQELTNWTGGDHLAMPEHRDPVADREQAIEIVGDHEHCQAQLCSVPMK